MPFDEVAFKGRSNLPAVWTQRHDCGDEKNKEVELGGIAAHQRIRTIDRKLEL